MSSNKLKEFKRIYEEAWVKQDSCKHVWFWSTDNSNCLDCHGGNGPICEFHLAPYLRCEHCDVSKAYLDARLALLTSTTHGDTIGDI